VTLTWYNQSGLEQQITFDLTPLQFVFFLSLITSVVQFAQAKMTLSVVEPPLKEFKDAERGVTQGIAMSRRSKDTAIFLGRLKWIIFTLFLLSFISVLELGSFAKRTAVQMIDEFYDNFESDGSLNATEIYKSLPIDNFSRDMTDNDKKDFDDALGKLTEWLETTDRYEAK